MAETADGQSTSGPFGTLLAFWALLGGLVLLAVVLMNTVSVVGAAFGKPFPGDFELTQMGVAVAAFTFLPYCQLTRANVTADIFTSRVSPRSVALLSAIASVVALIFGALLAWRMYAGMLDQKTYGYTTAILQVPHWWAFVPILISLVLWVTASAYMVVRDVKLTGR